MASPASLLLVIVPFLLIGQTTQGVNNNQIDLEPIQELTDRLMSSKNIDKVGGMIQKLIEKQGPNGLNGIADMFSTLLKEDNSGATGQILKGLGNIIQEKLAGSKRGDAGEGGVNIDPAMIGNIISMFTSGKSKEGGASFDPSMLMNMASMFLPKQQKEGGDSSGLDLSAVAGMVSMFMQKPQGKEGGSQGSFDPSVIANIASMFAPKTQASKESKPKELGIGDYVNMFGNFLAEDGIDAVGNMAATDGPAAYLQLLPTIMNTLSYFQGPEAEAREKEHAGHSWMLPPIFEKLHVLFDHFVSSPFGQGVMAKLGAEKYVKIFMDEKTGNFSYDKFVELLENHSFRRHWISMVTKRISGVVAYFADPYNQRKFVTTIQFFVNNFLKQWGVPKAALFDPLKPTETLSALANHFSKQYLGQKVDAKVYIGPAVKYIQDLLAMAEAKGIVGQPIDSDKLTNKLTDTINMDVIEPVVRVNRAYRFAKKEPTCAEYVMCLVNQDGLEDDPSLPGLKKALSKGASFLASWFLSGTGDNTFWTLYHVITEDMNCKFKYNARCDGFHVEEVKATTEYIHNEL